MKDKVFIVTIKYNETVKKIPGIVTIIIDNSPPNENLGFAKAVNIGVKDAISKGATKVLLLNPDLKISKNQIEELTSNNDGIVSPVLKTGSKLDFGGKINWMLGRTTHKKIASSAVPRNDIDYVTGACMLIDAKVFEKIGFFDERYFMYFEDVDFCLRAQKAGFNINVDRNIVVEHKLTKNRQKNNYVLKSNIEFVQKWISWYFKPIAFTYLFWMWIKIKI